ncbi:MAG: Dabb family protein [Flavobacteriaceae bacterium]
MKKLFIIIFGLLYLGSCEENKVNNEIDGVLVHSVYFWLNNPENSTEREEFETAIKKLLSTNKLAIKKHLGKPGNTEKREVVDNSYDYCMILTFPSLKAQRLYQDDPTHLIFIQSAKHLWKKVQVFDSMKVPF